MIDRIKSWADACDPLRCALLVGSRARVGGGGVDGLSDYDVALFFRESTPIDADDGWLTSFGTPLIVLPETVRQLDRTVPTRLVVYEEGHRIDFTLSTVDVLRVLSVLPALPPWLDAGYRVLVDKDRDSGMMVPPQGRGYAGRPPHVEKVLGDVQEFWWEALVVAGRLARGERHSAGYSAEAVMRHGLLLRMLEWRAQVERGWTEAVGPVGRGLDAALPEVIRGEAAPEACSWTGEEGWQGLQAMTTYYAAVARDVCEDVGAVYPVALERAVLDRLEGMRPRH